MHARTRRRSRTGSVVAAAVVVATLGAAPGATASTAPAAVTTGTDRGVSTAPAGAALGTASATVETAPVPHGGDAADDPAIWVDPGNPALSAVVATDKQGGLLVYDLAGQQLQYLPVGAVNNVDVRPVVGTAGGPTLGGRPAVLAVAGNRSTNSIGVYELDPGTRQLRDVAARSIVPGVPVYGSCLYRSAATGRSYVFVTSKLGQVEQWELFDDGSGRVDAARVRAFGLGSQAEGCVADDELGHVYVGEEAVGIWRFGAEPGDAGAGTLVAGVSAGGPLAADVEGLALTTRPDGTGYLIASSQGSDSLVVYAREGGNPFLVSFHVGSGAAIDGVERTDGLDVTTIPLGPAFPAGMLVVQDDANPGGNQNFKFVPWERVVPG
ncbi:phytase [Geodermatophilus sp. YIM 151500]|uniref:phytase n=1 Tax=Geodermatophilus sp. YIM 151500 TaxID=2984531 RepID=UPI0021E4E84F|nr:phytase [Geodermatophilus sp. YIM 151500]MCV2491111.1 phytase [Geodermatophilus sp. YIM 151500]